MKLEKELLSISARKKFDSNSTKKEIKYSRETNFKNFCPLGIGKGEKFVFEHDVSLKPNFNNNEPNNNLNCNRNSIINNNDFIIDDNKKSNLKKKKNKEDLIFSLLCSHKKVNFQDEKKQTNLNENKNLSIENYNALKEKTNNNLNNIGSKSKTNLKNLDFLSYDDDSKKINFDNNSNIQGVNILASNRLSLKDYYGSYLKENKENQAEDKSQAHEKSSNSTLNFHKPNTRSKSISSFEKIEDPKAYLLELFESKKNSKKAENKSERQENNSNDELTAKQKVFLLETNFNSIFNRTQKSINFKNNLFKKVDRIKLSKGLLSTNTIDNTNVNINYHAKQENKIVNDFSNNLINKKSKSSKENLSSKLDSKKSLEFILSSNQANKINQKVFDKINDMIFDFSLTDKLNKPSNTTNKMLICKSELFNHEMAFRKENKQVDNYIKTKLNNGLNNSSLPVNKGKITETTARDDDFKGFKDKKENVHPEQLIKKNRKVSIEDSERELEESVYKSNYY